MGCDIHIAVQVKNNDEWFTIIHPMGAYNCRNYRLFAILAGVRNAFDIIPISQPKGLPEGFIEQEHYPFWIGDHSFSFLTLQEIKNYDWGKKLKFGEIEEESTYKEICGSFFEWLDGLKEFTRLDYTPDDHLRLVFGFDS